MKILSYTLLAVFGIASLSTGHAKAKPEEYAIDIKIKNKGEVTNSPRAVTKINTPVSIVASVVNPNLPEYVQTTGVFIDATPTRNKDGSVTWSLRVTNKTLIPFKKGLPTLSTRSWESQFSQCQAAKTYKIKDGKTTISFTAQRLLPANKQKCSRKENSPASSCAKKVSMLSSTALDNMPWAKIKNCTQQARTTTACATIVNNMPWIKLAHIARCMQNAPATLAQSTTVTYSTALANMPGSFN